MSENPFRDLEPEMLDADLRESIIERGGYRFIHTPFYVGLVQGENDEPSFGHACTNRLHRARKTAYEEAVHERNWGKALFVMVERPYRTMAFDEMARLMTDAEYWELLADVWIDQENPEDFTEEWRARFRRPRRHASRLMTRDERKMFSRLPDELTIYRAAIGSEDLGLSWTLSPQVAKKFATRFGGDHRILRARIKKAHVRAYWTRRSEEEILVLDNSKLRDVEDVTEEVLGSH